MLILYKGLEAHLSIFLGILTCIIFLFKNALKSTIQYIHYRIQHFKTVLEGPALNY